MPFNGPNRWKSDGIHSGLYGRCRNIAHSPSVIASVVYTLECRLVFLWSCNIYDIFCVCDKLDQSKYSGLLLFRYGSEISLLSSQVRSCKNNAFLIPEECSHDFFCWWHTLQFPLPLGILFGVLPLISTWIQVQNGWPRSWDNLQQQAFTSYIILVQKISLCFSSCICQISWHPASRETGIAKLFSNCNYTAFASVHSVE